MTEVRYTREDQAMRDFLSETLRRYERSLLAKLIKNTGKDDADGSVFQAFMKDPRRKAMIAVAVKAHARMTPIYTVHMP
tara:strand:- start:5458 stop:5694 length:237 start_codon:yes stop_codon:yes gene_type:complete